MNAFAKLARDLKRSVFVGALIASAILPVTHSPASHAAEISGAGAGSPYPVYAAWAEAYRAKSGPTLKFQSVGSSVGIKSIKEKSVDFGATDVALQPGELAKDKLVNFPTLISGVVPFVNVPGVRPGELKLTGEVLADILAGNIAKWNAPAIAQLNKGLPLPDLPIVVVGRSDGAGNTYILAHYLAKVSADWKNRFGYDFVLKWPSSTVMVHGIKDMIAMVQRTRGAIGYCEFGFVDKNGLAYIVLENRDKVFVAPGREGFAAALAVSGWTSKGDYEEMLTNMPGKRSWPITGGTFIIMHKSQPDAAVGERVLQFFAWAFLNGDKYAADFGYIPLPALAQARAIREMTKIGDAKGRPLNWMPNQ